MAAGLTVEAWLAELAKKEIGGGGFGSRREVQEHLLAHLGEPLSTLTEGQVQSIADLISTGTGRVIDPKQLKPTTIEEDLWL